MRDARGNTAWIFMMRVLKFSALSKRAIVPWLAPQVPGTTCGSSADNDTFANVFADARSAKLGSELHPLILMRACLSAHNTRTLSTEISRLPPPTNTALSRP